jgi:hypothetical protein
LGRLKEFTAETQRAQKGRREEGKKRREFRIADYGLRSAECGLRREEEQKLRRAEAQKSRREEVKKLRGEEGWKGKRRLDIIANKSSLPRSC